MHEWGLLFGRALKALAQKPGKTLRTTKRWCRSRQAIQPGCRAPEHRRLSSRPQSLWTLSVGLARTSTPFSCVEIQKCRGGVKSQPLSMCRGNRGRAGE
jgi:hypothetical protein